MRRKEQIQHPGAVAREEASRSCSLDDGRRSFDTKQLPCSEGCVNSDPHGIPCRKSLKEDSAKKNQALDARVLHKRELNDRFSKLRQSAIRYGRSHCPNKSDIEDLVQDVMLKLSECCLKKEVPFPRALLRKIMNNILVDRHRYADRRPEEMLDDMDSCERYFLPESDQDDKCSIWEIIKMMQEIPTEYSTTLELIGEEHTTPEIAQMLDIPIGTVFSRIARGREMLREKLAR